MAASKEINGVRKISIKAVCGTPDIEKVIAKKKIDLMDVYGVAQRTKAVTTDYGDAVRFIGKFRAVNLETGEVYESTRLYLPSAMEEDLSAAMNAGGNAEFGVRINVNYDKSLATKYYYDFVSLIEPQNQDALLSLEAKMKDAAKALPAPKKG